jgi:hypothetical protein
MNHLISVHGTLCELYTTIDLSVSYIQQQQEQDVRATPAQALTWSVALTIDNSATVIQMTWQASDNVISFWLVAITDKIQELDMWDFM